MGNHGQASSLGSLAAWQAWDCLVGHLSALAWSSAIRWTTGCEKVGILASSFRGNRVSFSMLQVERSNRHGLSSQQRAASAGAINQSRAKTATGRIICYGGGGGLVCPD